MFALDLHPWTLQQQQQQTTYRFSFTRMLLLLLFSIKFYSTLKICTYFTEIFKARIIIVIIIIIIII